MTQTTKSASEIAIVLLGRGCRIVRRREQFVKQIEEAITKARNDALEEAAISCEEVLYPIDGKENAKSIRRLKEGEA